LIFNLFSGSNPLPLDYSSHSRESLHVLELDGIEFKQVFINVFLLLINFSFWTARIF